MTPPRLIPDDPRSAKPGNLQTIEVVRSTCLTANGGRARHARCPSPQVVDGRSRRFRYVRSVGCDSELLENVRLSPRVSPLGRGFLNVREAAEYLGLSPATLYVWRHRRQGPPSFRMGRSGRVMYRIETLDEWIREQEQADSRSNTSLNPVNAAPKRRAGYAATA
ncbi:helix-turn-helix transcriptional regulator [Streptomyces sp. NPDC058619]|uniref:helix-turn-helix transcriptional regulator n=1 Tax=Streptomyces sp. NPDC058619 TaxID=3346559 RepID=UPI0036473419